MKCVFIGVSEDVRGYKLWEMKPFGGPRVTIAMNVTFNKTHARIKCTYPRPKTIYLKIEMR